MCKIVLPGEFICSEEEYIPTKNVYLSGGNIYSMVSGYVVIDTRRKTIKVLPLKNLPTANLHDTVVGEVIEISKNVAIVIFQYVVGKSIKATFNTTSTIFIRNISETYIEDIHDALHICDIVLGRVVSVKPMSLTIKPKDLGVVKAFCSNCKKPLAKDMQKNELVQLACAQCHTYETRKTSFYYDNFANIK